MRKSTKTQVILGCFTALIICCVVIKYVRNSAINGRWKVVSACILLTSFVEEKESFYQSCSGKILTITDGKGSFEDASCLDTTSFNFVETDKNFIEQIAINNSERFDGCVKSLQKNKLAKKMKIYSAVLDADPKRPLYLILLSKNDLILYQDPYFIQLRK
ncbi:hypothetical protein [Flavobacterium sp.]|uniref:hypothetical protein n=1 Tax=Flavobacterium sp. TaxID=239 RepID=UPI002621E690|nr:hypothetical protein [Flavobacterium sp.]